MLTSIGSRSRSSTRKSRASLTGPSCQAGTAATVPAAPPDRRSARRGHRPATVADRARDRLSRRASCGERPRPPTRSRAATSTTTGGTSSTTRLRLRRAERRRLRLVPPLAPRTSTWWPAWALGAYRFSLEWSRIEPEEGEFSVAALDHYRRMCAACHERGIVPVVTFHHFTTPLAGRAREAGRRADAPDRFARFCERATAHLGDLIGMAVHPQRAQRGGRHGVAARRLPAAGAGPRPAEPAVNEALVPAHRLAVEAIRSGPGRLPGRPHPVDGRLSVQPGGEEWLRADPPADRRTCSSRPPAGDDFVGVQTYTRHAGRPRGVCSAPRRASPTTQMGYEFWPEALEGTIRRAADDDRGLPVLVTENGIGTDDDAARIEYVAGPWPGCGAASTTGSTSAATSTGACSTTSNGSSATADLRPGGGGPGDLRAPPKPSASWLGGVARANAL